MWTPVDTQFFGPYFPVAIANIYNSRNALNFRHVLEGLGAVTHYHNIGTPGDFLKVISQEESAPPYLVITAHGGDRGIEFGDDYMDGIDTSMLVEGDMTAQVIAEHVRLPGTVIVNTACDGGEEEMAEAFLSGGAQAYVGTNPNPNNVEHTIFLGHFFHSIFRRKMTPLEAWEKSARYDKASQLYLYYDRDGKRVIER